MKNFLPMFLTVMLAAYACGQQSDSALRLVAERDRAARLTSGKLPSMSAAEHLTRGQTYFENRLFPEAREHFQKVLDLYPTDPGVPQAIFGIGRSHMWERSYATAVPFLDRVAREFPASDYGREGLAQKAACHVRLGKNAEAAKFYEQYTVMYPDGEKIESAHLNIIDALREAGDYDGANSWVEKAVSKFDGDPTETNALHARLRMEIYRGRWNEAVAAADMMLVDSRFSGSMSSTDEVKFLKALALEKAGRKQQAMDAYASIPNTLTSYYGGLASERLAKNGGKIHIAAPPTARQISDSPVMFRSDLLTYAKKHKIDPRFMLAIMKQESSFRADAKSPAGARGLLQLVFDTALKYNTKAGFPNLQPDDLYTAATNIAIGAEYIATLKDEFGGLYEAIAASYNGGEDNAARWLNRSKPKEAGIFASEIGFAETKKYVAKVMTNYRIYQQIYDENLNKR